MFELQIIKRYLIPSKKRLSNSFISNISIFTIALTVWLLIVFLSVLKGVEKSWVLKLTTLQSPIRLVPNQNYYHSAYYVEDSFSEDTGFQHLNLFEKERAQTYCGSTDIIGELKKTLHKHRLSYDIYDVSAGILKINISRLSDGKTYESSLTQASYLTNPPIHSKNFQKIICPLDTEDQQGLKELNPLQLMNVEVRNNTLHIPPVYKGLEPVLLPKNYKDTGVKAGDRLEINLSQSFSLTGSTPSIYGYVCGFYDPGLMSVGTRVAFLRQDVIDRIVIPGQATSLDPLLQGGFFVYLDNISETKKIATALQKEPIMQFFDVVPYYEFIFAKEIMHQFQSDQILFSLIGFVILTIACLNIIAALILIVQEKKQEIGLLLALGASSRQIQRIFGALGFCIGFAGFAIGSLLAILTLSNLEWIVQKLLFLKGHPVVKALNFDPNASMISYEIILYVLLVTPLLAMIAGLIPAKQAAKIEPVDILKNG